MPIGIKFADLNPDKLPQSLEGLVDSVAWREVVKPILAAHKQCRMSVARSMAFYTLMPIMWFVTIGYDDCEINSKY